MDKKKRHVVVYVATSADGYIARRDGSLDWLDRHTAGDYGMRGFLRHVDTVLWGRKTYELALALGDKATAGLGRTKSYVFSHRPLRQAAPGFEFVREPLRAFMHRVRATAGKDVWVMGGAGLIGSLLDAGEVDAFVIHVIPTLIGEGIPLLAPRRRLVPLTLCSARRFPDGVMRLHYLAEPDQGPRRRGAGRRPRLA